MKRTAFAWAAVVASLFVVTPVLAEERAASLRSFERFELDSQTTDGLWIELSAFQSRERKRDRDAVPQTKNDLDVITTSARIAYGIDMFEAGVNIPFRMTDFATDDPTRQNFDDDGISDVRFYGKAVPIRTEWIDFGGGVELSVPTGDEDDRIVQGDYRGPAGRLGVMPFGTMALKAGSLELRAHGGYRFYETSSTAREVIFYGGGLFWPVNDVFLLRGEFIGATVDIEGPDRDDDFISFQPGVDMYLHRGMVDVMVRPTGLIGMNSVTEDWGIGGSIAVAWHPGYAQP